MKPSTNALPLEQPVIIKDKARYWQQHMEAWQASDLTQPAYCQQHTISLAAFGYWRTRLKKLEGRDDATPVNFFPVRLKQGCQNSLTLKINDRHSIEIDTNFDGDLLTRVIQAVEQVA
ncbi:MAG: hypothetical protein DRQ44_16790 [Gammaproteobacteria bacterium]|nr:MAG: hypothetical protein DRQ44_16790 [Gammaproteobacteria bacterium]